MSERRVPAAIPMHCDCREDYLDFSMEVLRLLVGTEGVAIRMADGVDGFPFERYSGLSAEFIAAEDDITCPQPAPPRQCLCLCGDVLAGREGPFPECVDDFGSYVRNRIREGDLETLVTSERYERSGCMRFGFETLGLVPIPNRDGACLGMLLLSDCETEGLLPAVIPQVEIVAKGLGRVIGKLCPKNELARGSWILLVEDEEQLRRVLQRLLTRLGYQVEVASDGTEALSRLHESRFDLVITDLEMPNMGGVELIETLRERYGPYGPAVIILSAYSAHLRSDWIDEMRVTANFSKPPPTAEMHDTILKTLRERSEPRSVTDESAPERPTKH